MGLKSRLWIWGVDCVQQRSFRNCRNGTVGVREQRTYVLHSVYVLRRLSCAVQWSVYFLNEVTTQREKKIQIAKP